VPSQLGFLTGNEGFDGVELSARAPWDALPRGLSLGGYPVLRNSDAHRLEQLGSQWNEAVLETFSVEAVRDALRTGKVWFNRAVG